MSQCFLRSGWRNVRHAFTAFVTRASAASDLRRAAFFGFFSASLFVLVNWRNYANDFTPLALVPVSVWREGNLDLDEYRNYYASFPPGYPVTESNGHLYPMKPMFVSLLATPLYCFPIALGVATENVPFWIGWGHLVAAAMAGSGLALNYLTVRRWGQPDTAVVFTLLLAFGTCVWTTLGQILNYHVGCYLCVSLLCFLIREFPLKPVRAGLAGLAAGAALGMRPTSAVLLFPLAVYLCLPGKLMGWKSRLAGLVGLACVPLLNALLNVSLFGHWYSTGYSAQEVDRWTTPLGEGALGLLIAPNSGILVQSPFAVFAVFGGVAVFRAHAPPFRGLLCAYGCCFLAYWLLFARWHDWQGGLTFSTRMLSEGYALWLPLAAVGWEWIRKRPCAGLFLGVAGAWSILYQVIGVATFDAVSVYEPPHLPWQPGQHFFVLHARWFGLLSTLSAVLITAAALCFWAFITAYVLAPFFFPYPGKQRHPGAITRSG